MSYQKFTKDVGIIGLTKLIIGLKGLIILPVITKLLGAENYGIWAQLIITLGLIASLANLGLTYALVRFLPGQKDKKEIQDGIYSVLTVLFGISLIISLILIFFSGPISGFIGGERVLVQILALAVIFECLNPVFFSFFRASRQMKKWSCFMIFQTLGEAGLIAIAVLLGHGLFGAILSLLIVKVISFLIMGGLIIKEIGIKVPKFLKTKEYLFFGLPTILGFVAFWIIQSSDRYLIGFFLGTLSVGYYAPGYTLANAVIFFVGPLTFVMLPALSKLYEENKINKVKNYIKYCLKYVLMIGIPSVFGLSILSKQFLTIFSTPEIASHGYQVIPLIAVSLLLYTIYAIGVVIPVFFLKKKTKVDGTINIIAAFLNLGLNFVFIPKFGIIGAAITTLIAYTVMFMLSIGYGYLKYRELLPEIEWFFILKSIFASMLMSLFIIWLNPFGLSKTLIAVFWGVLIYGVLIYLSGGITKKEVLFFKNFFGLTGNDSGF